MAAYITAIEGISTDLLGWTPHHYHRHHYYENISDDNSYCYLTFFCGNFGILLLNPSWLSVDGGRTALDVLEKMVSLNKRRGGVGLLVNHSSSSQHS